MDGATSIWYPAEGGGEAMHFRDYAERLEQYEAILHEKKLTDEQIVDTFDRPVRARHEARPLAGAFPEVTLEGSRFLADVADRAETIASSGCVVRMKWSGGL